MARRKSELDETTELVLQCLEQIETGGFSVLEEFCDRHPGQAETLRRRIEPLRRAGLLEQPQTAMPKRLGEFVLLDQLGGGGMGVVYRARQESLGREVALKVIRPDQLAFPETRARFRREVEVVARLQHPGIVPVYSFGEEAGTPYFAMERVHGATLTEVLDDLRGRDPATLEGEDLARGLRSTLDRRGGISVEVSEGELFTGSWSDACLMLVLQVARALDHAHGQGVLHRDLKPSNVLLSADGRALLFDFGLSSSDWVGKLTQSRSVFGSLPYMAPEQVTGRAADRRTDIYALGVTMYELLCLRLPFGDKSAVELREAILEGNPASIRARNPRVPLDVSTVCLKAMDRDPDRRYQDAGSFVRDLENALALRPVKARPAGPTLRAQRWAQRNPARAVAVALAILLVVIGPAAFAIQSQLANENLRSALDVADQERERAEQNLNDAFDTILIVMNRVNDDSLDDAAGIDELRADLFSAGRERLDDLMLQREQYPWAERLHARISRLLASAAYRSGQVDQAREANELALEGFKSLRGSEVENQTERGVAAALSQQAMILEDDGRNAEALDARAEVLAILERLWEDGPKKESLRIDLALASQYLGSALMDQRRFDEGRPYLERALLLVESHVDGPAVDRDLRNCYVNVLVSLATGERVYGSPESGAHYSERAYDAIDRVLLSNPGDRATREYLLSLLANESGMWNNGISFAACEERARSGLELADELQRDYPEVGVTTARRARLESNLMVILSQTGRAREAADSFPKVVERARERVRLEDSFAAKYALSELLFRQTQVMISLGDDEGAISASVEVMPILEALVALEPGNRIAVNLLGLQGLVHARLIVRNGGMVDLGEELAKFEERVLNPEEHVQVLASMVAEVVTELRARGRNAEANAGVSRGLDILEAGALAGLLKHDEVRDDTDLDPYRADERFAAVLSRLAIR